MVNKSLKFRLLAHILDKNVKMKKNSHQNYEQNYTTYTYKVQI